MCIYLYIHCHTGGWQAGSMHMHMHVYACICIHVHANPSDRSEPTFRLNRMHMCIYTYIQMSTLFLTTSSTRCCLGPLWAPLGPL